MPFCQRINLLYLFFLKRLGNFLCASIYSSHRHSNVQKKGWAYVASMCLFLVNFLIVIWITSWCVRTPVELCLLLKVLQVLCVSHTGGKNLAECFFVLFCFYYIPENYSISTFEILTNENKNHISVGSSLMDITVSTLVLCSFTLRTQHCSFSARILLQRRSLLADRLGACLLFHVFHSRFCYHDTIKMNESILYTSF